MSSDMYYFCFKQKTAYEMRISDWSSDVCSSDLGGEVGAEPAVQVVAHAEAVEEGAGALLVDVLVVLVPAGRHAVRGSSEERRVGKEGVSTGRSRWSPDH